MLLFNRVKNYLVPLNDVALNREMFVVQISFYHAVSNQSFMCPPVIKAFANLYIEFCKYFSLQQNSTINKFEQRVFYDFENKKRDLIF